MDNTCEDCDGLGSEHKEYCSKVYPVKEQKMCCKAMKYLISCGYFENVEYSSYYYIKGQTVIQFPNEEEYIPKICPICGKKINEGLTKK